MEEIGKLCAKFNYVDSTIEQIGKPCAKFTPPLLVETLFLYFVCPSVCLLQNLALTSPPQDRRIKSFFFELWWIQEGWGVKYLVLTSPTRWLIIET